MASRNRSLSLFTEPLPAQAGGMPPQTPHTAKHPRAGTQQLWVCAFLFKLPLEVFARPDNPRDAFAVSEGEASQQRILSCNQAASALGVRSGQSLNSALALAPDLLLKTRQPALEQAALLRLASWASQFTSQVCCEDSDHLLLEVRGSLRLFGGLAALRIQIEEGLAGLGYASCIAFAPTPLAALWLARAGRAENVLTIDGLSGRLGVLPVSAAAWSAQVQHNLRSLGLRQLRDCLRLPRDGFARRIGKRCLEQLDKAMGRCPDPRSAWQPPTHYHGQLELPAAVSNHVLLLHALERLVRELGGFLRAREAGIQDLKISLQHQQGAATTCSLQLLQEERDPEHLLELIGERMERLSLPAPVIALGLTSGALQTLQRKPENLFAQRERHTASPVTASALVDRLRARLGGEAVHGLCLVPEHRPESAWCVSEPGQDSVLDSDKQRPFWLLKNPRLLVLHDSRPWLDGVLTLESGPERIETGWWDGEDVARDYYRARNSNGASVWIFRERRGNRDWFLHGVFG